MLINETRRGLTEAQARNIVLVRAFEVPLAEPWTQADQTWASEESSRLLGEATPYGQWVAQRAHLASTRIAQRAPEVGRALTASQGAGWLNWAIVMLAFASGLVADAVGSAQRISILSPPLLALMAWNIGVYVLLTLVSLRGAAAADPARSNQGPLRRAFEYLTRRAMHSFGERVTAPPTHAALLRFFADWMRCSRPLQAARVAMVLHLSAAALTAGLLVSMYVRGLAFEYRAGWDSTFLTPQNLHSLLSFMLGWASHLSGIVLPDVAELATLRFSHGPGENAARWIHLYALCVAVVVLVPRSVLAAMSARKLWRYNRRFELPLDDVYFQRLRMAHAHTVVPAYVLPYSYQLSDESRAGLLAVLARGFGPGIDLTVEDPVPLGGEDELAHWLPAAAVADSHHVIVLLFALTATPERENHGAFIEALKAAGTSTAHVFVLIDESGFRKRFSGSEGAKRLEQRRAAWQRLLRDLGQTPIFVNLVDPDLDTIEAQLQPFQWPSA